MWLTDAQSAEGCYVADNKDELSEIIFGFGFKEITDIQGWEAL